MEEGSASDSGSVLSTWCLHVLQRCYVPSDSQKNMHFKLPLDTSVSACVNNKWQLTDRG